VQQGGIRDPLAIVRTAAEEIDGAAAANHVDCPVPGLGLADGLDRDNRRPVPGSWRGSASRIGIVIAHDEIVRAECGGTIQLGFAPAHRDQRGTVQLGEFDKTWSRWDLGQ